jgi:hypothetical protein
MRAQYQQEEDVIRLTTYRSHPQAGAAKWAKSNFPSLGRAKDSKYTEPGRPRNCQSTMRVLQKRVSGEREGKLGRVRRNGRLCQLRYPSPGSTTDVHAAAYMYSICTSKRNSPGQTLLVGCLLRSPAGLLSVPSRTYFLKTTTYIAGSPYSELLA